ncbi:MAG: D-alanine--D-alanine ligase [Pseudoflavonifractor sp.]|nr:D-alanine--D-alanine ligase [Pseudoflavonifractor sp.]
MKIVVLSGGLSPERNVSRSSGTKIVEALRGLGHQAALVDMFFGLEDYPELTGEALYAAPVPESWRRVDRTAPDLCAVRASRRWDGKGDFGPGVLELCQGADIVFLALHGQCGEDGRVQAAFDLLDIPYTGSGYLGSAIAMDKDMTKRLVAGQVDTPAWSYAEYTQRDVDRLTSKTPVPCVVKPVDSGSSIGVSIAHDKKELHEALTDGLHFGGRCVLERYISGREIQVGVLDGKALPAIEIIPKVGFYDYENKYQPGAAEEVCPAPITPEQAADVARRAEAVYHTLGLTVYSRADFILDSEGKFWFLEINTLPGMTPTSLMPQEAAAVGIDYPALCQHIIDSSLRQRRKP